ncbi:MAG: hypothetical protein ACRCYX_03360 [Dermatophilaceae bacterium]
MDGVRDPVLAERLIEHLDGEVVDLAFLNPAADQLAEKMSMIE